MTVDAKDPTFAEIVDLHAEVQPISDAFNFTEGPIWHPTEHHLIFSDIPENKLYRYSEADGVAVYREPSNLANGNTYDKQGRVLSCEHGTSRVVREQNGQLDVLASHYDGKALNSPNDIVVGADGSVYFTDPTYGRQGSHGIERAVELEHRGVYRITPAGELVLLSADFDQPNGLCLNLDETALYVADTPQQHVRRFALDGNHLTGGEEICYSPAPDGLKIDSAGNLYAGGPKGIYCYTGEGQFLGVFRTPAFAANFTWGNADLKTLFITASTTLWQVPVKVPGIPLF